jgi:hypothetical protein
VNRLAAASSAYLRSAAHQPIAWHPWGSEAFTAAKASDKPVLLDIGAVWCHWCHVMDGESYEDPALADFVNQHFICVKVDRDERPDVDARYQRAVQAISGQGGWPLTAFLTPDGTPFYGGTYFPPDGKYGRPGFRSVMEQVLKVYRTQRDRVTTQADAIRRVLSEQLDEAAPGEPGDAMLDDAADAMRRFFDPEHGGFGTQPKFPHPGAVLFLLGRYADRREPWVREMVDGTLQGMARGGVHDQLAGGFHRYSVDAEWIVPHFEKMSYDNAELLKAYLEAYAAFGAAEYLEVARGIVRWVRETLADPDGGYGASQDADVGLHDDGDYFTWTFDEAREAIDDENLLELAAAYYDIGTAGEMQHDPSKNVLFVAEPLTTIAPRLGLSVAEAAEGLARARQRLLAAREKRPVPGVDGTRYVSWNGMLAAGLIRAGTTLDDPWARDHALRTLARIRSEAADPAALAHAPGVSGLLDDQVQVAAAAVEAYEAGGDPQWLEWAVSLLDRVWEDYADPAGGLFDVARSQTGEGLLPARAKPIQDAPTPSPNGVAAITAARLAELTGEARWGERRDQLVRAFAGTARDLGLFGATILQAVDWVVHPPTHLVIVDGAGPGEELADGFHRLALRSYFPRRVVQRVRTGDTGVVLPKAVSAMLSSGEGTRAFACVGSTCQAPATTLESWSETLNRVASPVD